MIDKTWIDFLADVFSGRNHNTLVSLDAKLQEIRNEMTANEQRIINAANSITEAGQNIQTGIDALRARIEALQGVEVEDLSDELTALDNAAASISSIGSSLAPAAPGTPAEEQASAGGPTIAPIVHEDIPPTPLAGSSGPTDAGVPTEVQAPGNPNPDPATTAPAEDAQAEAGTVEASSPGGWADPEPATAPADTEPAAQPAEESAPPVVGDPLTPGASEDEDEDEADETEEDDEDEV